MIFRRQHKAGEGAPFASSITPADWEPATVFFTQKTNDIVHLMVMPDAQATDGAFEIVTNIERVPPDLRRPIVRVEVLLRLGELLSMRQPGPGRASWFARSQDAFVKGNF